jgi:hypothetical protein
MKRILIIISGIFLFACHSSDIIDKNNVIEIALIESRQPNKEVRIRIKNKDSISNIIKTINNADKEPAIFLSEYKIVIYYQNDINRTILCNSQRINIDGITYKLNKSLKSLIIAK